MTKETSKNASTRKKAAPAPKEPALKEHALSYENYMVSQLASISAELNNVQNGISDIKTDLADFKKDVKADFSANNARLTTLEAEVKSRPTFMQMITTFALINGILAGLIISIIKL